MNGGDNTGPKVRRASKPSKKQAKEKESEKTVAAKGVPGIEMPPVPFMTPPDEPLLPTGLQQGQIKFVVNRNIARIRFCYDTQLRRNPNLTGKLIVSFEIKGSGRVSDVEIKSRKFKGTYLDTCVTSAIKTWHFPKFAGDPITVDYPFIFSAF